MTGAPEAPVGRSVVVATDLDGTFTRPDLTLAPEALQRARRLRQQGIHVLLATGRPSAELRFHALRDCFDAFIIEGGAVWGRPGRWTVPPAPQELWWAAEDLAAAGHDVREGWASFSAPASAAALLEGRPAIAWRCNRDRIDVTAAGIDKGTGLHAALADLCVKDPWVLGIGDAANDLPLFAAATASVAVANAEPGLASAALHHAPHPAHRGFLWAVSRLGKRGA